MGWLVIPDWAKAEGLVWVVYEVVSDRQDWWQVLGCAEVKIKQEVN